MNQQTVAIMKSNIATNKLADISTHKVGTYIYNLSCTGSNFFYHPDIVSSNDYFPFGSQMVGRTFNSPSYKYGFNGKEKDDEGMGGGSSTYDYGFRIYNPSIAKFLSVDPLTKSYPWYTPYQFAGNKPIVAIDLDGLEEKIVIYNEDKYGNVTSIEKISYNNVEDYGPLGNGTYTVHKKVDGTFSESYTTGEGNLIQSFEGSSIPKSKFIEKGGKYSGFEKRLNARLIEGVVENALIKAGNNPSEVREDVQVLENAPDNFIGKFATLKEGSEGKYTDGLESSTPSSPHKSNNAKTTGEIGNSDVLIKFYDGATSSTDNVPNHVGLVREGIFDHGVEAVRAVADPKVNIGAENATRVKNNTEKKQE